MGKIFARSSSIESSSQVGTGFLERAGTTFELRPVRSVDFSIRSGGAKISGGNGYGAGAS